MSPRILVLLFIMGPALSSRSHAAAPLQDPAARFEALVERYYKEDLAASPTMRTERTTTRSEPDWTPLTDEYRAQRANLTRQRLQELSSVDRRALSVSHGLRYGILVSSFRGDLLQARAALNSFGDSGNVYEAISSLPELLIRNQKIVDAADAQNHVSRLRALGPVLREAIAAGDERHRRALGYTWGFVKILSAREEARKQLGSRFDIKRFHSVLLDDGPLPPDVMDRQIEAWVDARRTPPPPPPVAGDLSLDAVAAREEGLKSSIAWDVLESLTTEVGARPVGTPAMDRARDWAIAKFKAMGFTNVRSEPFMTPAWTRVGIDTAEVLSPYPQRLQILALSGSASTPPGGLVAEIALFRSYQAFLESPPGSLRGKIAVVTQVLAKTQDFSAYSDLRAQRTQGAAEAAKRGAVGYMMRSLTTGNTRLPHGGTGADAQIASVALSGPDADLLEHMADRGKAIRVRIDVHSVMNRSANAYNLSAEIPGTSDEVIILGGHLDSWDQGTGALDDAAGIAIAMAAARAATASGARPRRTIRVVLWGSEEQGGSSEAYFAAHQHELEKMIVVGESDDGADGIYSVALPTGADAHPAMKAFRSATASLRIVNDRNAARYGGEDVAGLVNAGVPTVLFRQSVERYMDIHHSADDTLDKVDPQKMAQSVATWAAFLRTVAYSDIDFRKLNR